MKNFLFALLIVLILLPACSLSDNDVKQDINKEIDSLPSTWSTSNNASSASIPSSWWTDFHDSGLNQYLLNVADNNKTLKISAQNIKLAIAQKDIASSAKYPVVNFQLNGSKSLQKIIGIPIPGSGDVFSSRSSAFGSSFNVSWEADLWDKIKNSEEGAEYNIITAKYDFQGVKLALISQAAQLWFTSVGLKHQKNLLSDNLDLYSQLYNSYSLRYSSGLIPSDLINSTEVQKEIATIQLNQIEEQYKILLSQLNILAGEYPNREIEVSGQLPVNFSPIPVGFPADILSQRPDLASAEKQVYAAAKSIDIAKADLYPKLSFSGNTGTRGSSPSNTFNKEYIVWQILGSLAQNIFDAGRTQSNIKASRIHYKQSLYMFGNTLLNALGEVENAILSEQETKERLMFTENILNKSELIMLNTENKYNSGLSSFNEYITAKINKNNAEINYTNALLAYITSRINLYVALGGSFKTNINKESK